MVLALLLIGLLALCALAVAVGVYLQSRRRDSLTGATVVLHLRDERTLRGVLVATYPDRIVLRDACWVQGRVLHPLGGAQHIPMTNVSFLQEITVLADLAAAPFGADLSPAAEAEVA